MLFLKYITVNKREVLMFIHLFFTAMSDASPGSFENNHCTGKFNHFIIDN